MTWWWLLTGLVPPVLFLAIYWTVLARRRRLVERLEARWSWLGPPREHLGGGRAFVGEVDGRPVEVTWFEHTTRVVLGATPRLRAAFGRPGQPPDVADAADAPRVELPGRVGYGPPDAVRSLDAAPGVSAALGALLGTEPDRSLRAVELEPGRSVSWFARNLPERDLGPDDARRRVDALLVVARAAEDLAA